MALRSKYESGTEPLGNPLLLYGTPSMSTAVDIDSGIWKFEYLVRYYLVK
jgi:hypothetical protein